MLVACACQADSPVIVVCNASHTWGCAEVCKLDLLLTCKSADCQRPMKVLSFAAHHVVPADMQGVAALGITLCIEGGSTGGSKGGSNSCRKLH